MTASALPLLCLLTRFKASLNRHTFCSIVHLRMAFFLQALPVQNLQTFDAFLSSGFLLGHFACYAHHVIVHLLHIGNRHRAASGYSDLAFIVLNGPAEGHRLAGFQVSL
jgi:hypothetical protein